MAQRVGAGPVTRLQAGHAVGRGHACRGAVMAQAGPQDRSHDQRQGKSHHAPTGRRQPSAPRQSGALTVRQGDDDLAWVEWPRNKNWRWATARPAWRHESTGHYPQEAQARRRDTTWPAKSATGNTGPHPAARGDCPVCHHAAAANPAKRHNAMAGQAGDVPRYPPKDHHARIKCVGGKQAWRGYTRRPQAPSLGPWGFDFRPRIPR